MAKKTKTKKVAAAKKVVAKKVVKMAPKAPPKAAKPAPTPKKELVIETTQIAEHRPMTQAELEEVEQNLQDSGYRLSIMTNISDAERKMAFEAALERAIKAKKPYETTWEGNIVTLWVKKEK